MYKHHKLPDHLVQKESEIHGSGVFANQHLYKGEVLGQTHVTGFLRHLLYTGMYLVGLNVADKYYRTYLGSLYNHSNDPNCQKVWNKDGYALKVIKHIKEGTELTVNYTFYSPSE